jgi:monoamine oxidase
MARSRLFSFAQRALMLEGEPLAGSRALSRRQALLLGGAAALAACTPVQMGATPSTGGPSGASDIAIIGGGIAGLTLAYRLSRAGRRATIYEASGRLGGRMFTKRAFNNEGMFCELGGELVDTNHKPLIDLAQELGVGIQKLKVEKDGGEDVYMLGGKLHREHELLRGGRGAFLPIARQMARDKKALTDADDNWTKRAHELDQISIAQYLRQFRGKAAPWVLDLLDLAYAGEYGMPSDRQSALNLVDFMAPDPSGDFAMFGESDEVYRIEGGSSSLPDALAAKLGNEIAIRKGAVLNAVTINGGRLRLSFTGDRGGFDASHDTVVFALPFTKLREVAGIEAVGLDPLKLKCIRELGYGDNAKIMVGTTGRPWTGPEAKLPAKSSGEFYSNEFQVAWETSRGQTGTRGILTNFLTATSDQAAAMERLQRGLREISPAMADSLDPSNVASFFWAKHPYTRGSYISPSVGQYTTLLEIAATPEMGGKLQFAGEHTSADFGGFMCGGVDSGERVAAALLGTKAAGLTAKAA